ncbi:amyloid-beta A4 precursor protein-binding family A member 1 isoform X1 [Erpetoichthys calabaricus]|uniref:Amyloid beta protein binding family A member 1 n=1 Tax=Erpetoichthys calabaricus TaxID=27687 RepID=A0A8C4RK75_ERPCA|nr:amyloid-beta A4 precursor protein-binding family A member 1 isoform X1 [Erpetoichthys calabaricus]XP_051783738.1 amyloid-beta A4 precursor protein-binding family A member 1 isoform X1 [Erpetoichthys calabaricus]XP_051783739.1 amyloid-beta A4 precursor protein-binding family A member 1 isoform X1 [Erpetoichthys calabaricus]XP_051783740.1 amyloid-beta A4 precursor protein-binding family A member 1 isoform X1 [Erpetoichthys calabaricus]XP_051783741.1 amyloid-beta A4 precursor protein-binding fa
MSHRDEAELEDEPGSSGGDVNEAVEADIECPDVEEEQHAASSVQFQRPDHSNSGSMKRGRVRQQLNSNGQESGELYSQQQQPSVTRYRRFDGTVTGNPARGQRKSQEEPEQQTPHRAAVTRYRRQADGEARIRAQQQRQRRQHQQKMAEAEAMQPSPPLPAAVQPSQPIDIEYEDIEDEDQGSALARSASTESGFHNHTDTAEGDMIASEAEAETASGGEAVEDENAYALHYRPEAEEYTESAEAEQHEGPVQVQSHPPPPPADPLPHFRSLDHNGEVINSAYSGYVYTHRLFQGTEHESRDGGEGREEDEDEPYAEPYADYGLQEHVYEEIGDTPPEVDHPQSRVGFRLFEHNSYRQEALGARLHHYDERSDGESDSPEKEAEFAPYPRMDSYDQEEDIDQIVAEVKQSMSSQSLDQAATEDRPESEQNSLEPGNKEPGESPPRPTASSPVEEQPLQRHSKEKRDAISLAIKDIKEAIEEVKTRTIRSPYTPDEPKEPIWVMRQDISPTRECDNQRQLGGDSPGSGSASPQGAESSSIRQHLHDGSESSESSANKESRKSLASFPTYVEVPGPCDPEDLIDGIIFAANYLGSTQLLSDKTPSKNVRMMQAQEAVSRIKMAQKLAKSRKKAPEGESQPMTEVDLFISTQRIKVLNADSQETMMDHPLRTISYIADIGNIVVLMARRRMPRSNSQENVESSHPSQDEKRQYKMICHVFESEDAQLIAQSIGQAFSVAYQEFLRANGINPEDLSQKEYSDLLNTQDMYNDDLIHFSKSENCKDVCIDKQKGEILGVVIVESGWGSILPTVIIANMMHSGPAEKSGRLNIGDQIMSINGTSLVGLPLSTCQSIIKGLKNQSRIKLNIVRCPPVTTVLIRRPDLRYQLGFSVQNGIICSLMRGGIAERGGVRVGHRIIEINGQSVVATPHEKIVHILSNAVGEIHMKTMPAAMYRLLTAQEQPVYI